MAASADQRQLPSTAGPIPPHGRLLDLLPEEDRRALLEWAIASEANFKPANIFYDGGRQNRVDPEVRQSLKHRGVGPFEPVLRERLLARLPEVMAAAGYRGPEPRSLEFELNAYGEGAHFRPHFDIPIGGERRAVGRHRGEDRLISAVYYFYSEPKGFSGGMLRLYRFGAGSEAEEDCVDLEPAQNSAVIFPSWAKHSVTRVSCPSGRFADFRFGLNCWFCRRVAA